MKYTTVFSVLIVTTVTLVLSGCGRETPIRQTHNARPVAASAATTRNAPGLLLVAHGSPMSRWNKALFDLEREVGEKLGQGDNPFHAVKLVFMEFAEPTIADGVAEMESAGCDSIVVVPLLIAPSSHSHWDVPTLLGLYTDERMEALLKEEGATPVRSKLPIMITSTMDQGDLFEDVLLRRVQALSKDPENEAIVVLAHGDAGLDPIWGSRMRKVVTYLCGKTGISYGDYAFVHVGQAYGLHGAPVIAEASDQRKRVLVVGCYLSMGVSRMHKHFMERGANSHFAMLNPLKDKDIALADHGLLPDTQVADWVVKTARQAAQSDRRCAHAN